MEKLLKFYIPKMFFGLLSGEIWLYISYANKSTKFVTSKSYLWIISRQIYFVFILLCTFSNFKGVELFWWIGNVKSYFQYHTLAFIMTIQFIQFVIKLFFYLLYIFIQNYICCEERCFLFKQLTTLKRRKYVDFLENIVRYFEESSCEHMPIIYFCAHANIIK